ncbi:DNA-directed RNA polymerase III subunit RPC9-like [Mangifera indica]|uniref:DNA-directed RNA polymerase III subunit RPC9-like n=1 Tax=Mangifera indica TaxID=29780 RepID=UPI001CF9BB89|nr:DNA-directed RNA polymerase III subunit RPC9-like [Mangifera indica]XP_044499694.1 DNA-directed RNA polymerase III subunit RPC9-like [Mangifera indica]
MKILEGNAGALTNFEVLDFLRSRGASKDPTRVLVPVAPSEFKVYDYLVESVACNQTRENVNEFLEQCKKFKLAKAEMLNIINIRPSSLVEIDSIIEQSDTRFDEEQLQELIDLVVTLLPPHPNQTNIQEGTNENEQGTAEGTKENEKGTTEETNEGTAEGPNEIEQGTAEGDLVGEDQKGTAD